MTALERSHFLCSEPRAFARADVPVHRPLNCCKKTESAMVGTRERGRQGQLRRKGAGSCRQ